MFVSILKVNPDGINDTLSLLSCEFQRLSAADRLGKLLTRRPSPADQNAEMAR
jgi:hypothetical protein